MGAALPICLGQAATVAQEAPAPQAADPASLAIPDPLTKGATLPGDDKLTCPQVLAESRGRLAQLDVIEKEREAIVYKKGAKTRALEMAGTLLGGALPGPLGQAASLASASAQMATTRSDANANYGAIDRKSEWVMDRMDRMNEMYLRDCTGGG